MTNRRFLPWVDAHRCGRFELLGDGTDPDAATRRLHEQGALAVGPVVATRKACSTWYTAWEEGGEEHAAATVVGPAPSRDSKPAGGPAPAPTGGQGDLFGGAA